MFSNVTIKPFQPEDQAMVKNLIIAGLAEHWGELDSSKNPDLDDITSTYASGAFFVAWFNGEIVGTGALIAHSAGIAQIVRMSVAQAMRRKRVATQILHHLIQYAKDYGYQKIVLETTKDWYEAIEFYLHNGFRFTHFRDSNVYFVLDLFNRDKPDT